MDAFWELLTLGNAIEYYEPQGTVELECFHHTAAIQKTILTLQTEPYLVLEDQIMRVKWCKNGKTQEIPTKSKFFTELGHFHFQFSGNLSLEDIFGEKVST